MPMRERLRPMCTVPTDGTIVELLTERDVYLAAFYGQWSASEHEERGHLGWWPLPKSPEVTSETK